MWINEENIAKLNDAYANNEQIKNDFIKDAVDLVDIIHGNATLPIKPGFAGGKYKRDVSKYVIGWILGIEWDPDFVEGTNQIVLKPNNIPVLGGPDSVWDQFKDNKGQAFGLQLSVPIFNGWSVKNNVERNKVNLEKSKIALEQQELDLQRNVYTAFTDAKGALKTHESAVVALESRQEAFNYAKERYAVGMMNSFDFNQAQTLLTNAQSEVIRTKYDYIFKIKILEFYFGIPLIKKQ